MAVYWALAAAGQGVMGQHSDDRGLEAVGSRWQADRKAVADIGLALEAANEAWQGASLLPLQQQGQQDLQLICEDLRQKLLPAVRSLAVA